MPLHVLLLAGFETPPHQFPLAEMFAIPLPAFPFAKYDNEFDMVAIMFIMSDTGHRFSLN